MTRCSDFTKALSALLSCAIASMACSRDDGQRSVDTISGQRSVEAGADAAESAEPFRKIVMDAAGPAPNDDEANTSDEEAADQASESISDSPGDAGAADDRPSDDSGTDDAESADDQGGMQDGESDVAADETASNDDAGSEDVPHEANSDAGASAARDSGGVEDAAVNVPDPAPSCLSTTTLSSGNTFGEYYVSAIRVAPALEPGAYVVWADASQSSLATLFKDDLAVIDFIFDPSASVAGSDVQTIIIPGYFELDLGSNSVSDLSALGDSIFDGCHVLQVAPQVQLTEGATNGSYVLEELTLAEGLPSGTYTFYASSGNAGSVVLLLNGDPYDTLEYEWRTTIGLGASYTFDFSGLILLTVTRQPGTSNLFGMADWIFNGRYEIVVP